MKILPRPLPVFSYSPFRQSAVVFVALLLNGPVSGCFDTTRPDAASGELPANTLKVASEESVSTVATSQSVFDSLGLTVEILERSQPEENVVAEVTLANNSNQSIRVTMSGYAKEVEMRVYDMRNRVVPPTAFGKVYLSEIWKPGEFRYISGAWTAIEAGDETSWAVDLTACFDLQPGIYQLVAVVRVDAIEDDWLATYVVTTDGRVEFEVQ